MRSPFIRKRRVYTLAMTCTSALFCGTEEARQKRHPSQQPKTTAEGPCSARRSIIKADWVVAKNVARGVCNDIYNTHMHTHRGVRFVQGDSGCPEVIHKSPELADRGRRAFGCRSGDPARSAAASQTPDVHPSDTSGCRHVASETCF